MDFIIDRVKLICACDVAGTPETHLYKEKFDIRLMDDPRFIKVVSKIRGDKFPPTVIPLSNVAYFFLEKMPEEVKPVKGKK